MRKTLLILLIFLSTRVQAQVTMTVQLPPEGILLKAQLWNIVLVSAANRPVNVRIVMRMTSAESNEPVLTGMSRSITLQKGGRQLKLDDVMPVTYEYLSPLADRSAAGLLPAGNYLTCYQLIVVNSKDVVQPGEECIPLTIAPVSPPLLNTPANGSVSETRLPQFTWLPPAPVQLFNDLNYELLLTEIYAGQSAEEAVQINIPVYRAPRLKTPYMNYPSGGMKLDTAKRYAWTVIARNGKQFATQTETWTFRISNTEIAKELGGDAYLELKKEADGTVATVTGDLHFSYTNETGERKAAYQVLSLDEGNRVVQKGELDLQPGLNQLELRLGRQVDEGRHYLFVVRNNRNERWQVKFMPAKR